MTMNNILAKSLDISREKRIIMNNKKRQKTRVRQTYPPPAFALMSLVKTNLEEGCRAEVLEERKRTGYGSASHECGSKLFSYRPPIIFWLYISCCTEKLSRYPCLNAYKSVLQQK